MSGGGSAWQVFEVLADRSDAWYVTQAGRVLSELEVAALRPLLAGSAGPGIEVGAGSGRFASSLGLDAGLDPAGARARGRAHYPRLRRRRRHLGDQGSLRGDATAGGGGLHTFGYTYDEVASGLDNAYKATAALTAQILQDIGATRSTRL